MKWLAGLAFFFATVFAWGQALDPNNKSPNICLSGGNLVAMNCQCGMQLGGQPIFCEPFDVVNPGTPSRTGGLDPNVWGVSRLSQYVNIGQQNYNVSPSVHIQDCTGTTTYAIPGGTMPNTAANPVAPDNDVVVCNGQMREALNDNLTLVLDAGRVAVLATYPKQPFDFAGRTGTVSFDVSNDQHLGHAAWPEFWITDLPIPAPFTHFAGPFLSFPQNGFGLRLDGGGMAGQQGTCPTNANIGVNRWTIESAVIVNNWVGDDTLNAGGAAVVTILDCAINSPDNSGVLNHVEVRVSQTQIDLYGTDAGTTTPLKHLASITNINLGLTRGLVWLNDVHYNADKDFIDGADHLPSQREHTFVWDNLAFDGPFTFRDFSYDALDDLTPFSAGGAVAGSVTLGKLSAANAQSSWDVLNMPASPNPAAVRVLFNFFHEVVPTTLNVTVNGHAHAVSWPYPDSFNPNYRTLAVTIPVTDLVTGTNVVQIGADQQLVTSSVNIVLANVPGGVPVLPGNSRAYP